MSTTNEIHSSQSEIQSMQRLEKDRGNINWSAAKALCVSNTEVDRIFSDILKTEGETGKIDLDSLDAKLLLYYLYANNGGSTLLQNVYKRFKKPDGMDREEAEELQTIPNPEIIIAKAGACLHAEPEHEAGARVELITVLSALKHAAVVYGVTEASKIDQYMSNPASITTETLGVFSENIRKLYALIRAQKKALAHNITVRPAPKEFLFLCIKEELNRLGRLAGADLDAAAASDFAAFVVGVTSVDFDGKIGFGTGDISDTEQIRAAAAGAWGALKASPQIFTAESASGLLARFGLSTKSSPQEIEQKLNHISTPVIARLIWYLRRQATVKRKDMKGVLYQGINQLELSALEKFVKALEDIVAKRMGEAIREGDSAKILERARSVTNRDFHNPLIDSDNHPDAVEKKMRAYVPPKPPKDEGKKDLETKLVTFGGLASVVDTIVQSARLIFHALGWGKEEKK